MLNIMSHNGEYIHIISAELTPTGVIQHALA